jgi:hypothetical protein
MQKWFNRVNNFSRSFFEHRQGGCFVGQPGRKEATAGSVEMNTRLQPGGRRGPGEKPFETVLVPAGSPVAMLKRDVNFHVAATVFRV